MEDSDDEEPKLSSNALAALQDFYVERDKDLEAFEQLRSTTFDTPSSKLFSMSTFKEDWNASQFWFTDETATRLAKMLLDDTTPDTRIAVISAPSVFIQLKNLLLLTTNTYPTPAQATLLEFDERFEVLGHFVKYDFNRPTDLPKELKGSFDRVLADPPYHSHECLRQFAQTTKWLLKAPTLHRTETGTGCRLSVCTGSALERSVMELWPGLHTVADFEPEHTRRLDNRYALYTAGQAVV